MSVIWCHEVFDQGGSADVSPGGGDLKYRRTFQVLTDSYDDGVDVVQNAPDLPRPYAVYQKGTDYDPTAVALHIDAKRDQRDQPLLWHVTIEYRALPGINLGGGTGGQTDITCYLPSFRTWSEPYEIIAQDAWLQFIGPDPTTPVNTLAAIIAAIAGGSTTKRTVVNSCGDAFADGVTTRKWIRCYELSRYEWYYDLTTFAPYDDSVNDAEFWGHGIGTVRLLPITGELVSVQDSLLWRVTYQWQYKPDGWGDRMMDVGTRIWYQSDGSLATSTVNAVALGPIVGSTGTPVSGAVMLDGKGWGPPAVSGVATIPGGSYPPYEIAWHHLVPKTFASLPVFDTDAGGYDKTSFAMT